MDTVFWVVLFIVCVVVEAVTYQMITTWFAIGAVFASVLASFEVSTTWQITAFLIVSILCLLALRPISLKCLKNKDYKSNTDALLGDRVLITENTDSLSGRGKIRGMEWSVRTENEEGIEAGQVAYVKRVEGVKLIVSKGE